MAVPVKEVIEAQVQYALVEDIGSGDITAALLPDLNVEAHILSREPMLMCGQAWAAMVFQALDNAVCIDWHVEEATYLEAPQVLCTIQGKVRSILTAERTALNFLQTLSGTATTVHRYRKLLKNKQVMLLDTRKTLPGLREAQKYAVVCGGGVNHRMGLYDAFLIKENHIKAYGSVAAVIQQARQLHPEKFLEIEVETLHELREAMHQAPDRILLDNFSLDMMREAVRLNTTFIPLEVSGGVSEDALNDIADTGIQCISMGALTKHLQAIDLSLLIKGPI